MEEKQSTTHNVILLKENNLFIPKIEQKSNLRKQVDDLIFGSVLIKDTFTYNIHLLTCFK